MKLRLYKNLKGHNFASGVDFPIRFEIYDRDFKGTASEIPQMGSIPLTLEFGNSGDRVTEPIKKTSLSFSLIKELGVDYSFFYTSDAKKYKIVVSSGVFNWVGYVAQDSFQEDLIYKGEISITAIDNLSYLDSVNFTLKGWQKLGDIITHCVTDTGVDKPLLYDDDFLISKNIAFKDWMVNVGDLAESTKLEALESVLSSIGARIEQTNANWRISTLYQRRFPTKISKVDKLYKLDTKELVPAKKQVLVSHDLFTPPVFDKFPSENDYKEVSNTSSVPLWKKYKGISKTGWTNAAGTIKVVTGISEQTSDVGVSGLPLSEYGEGFSIVCAHKSTNLNSAPSANVTIQKIFNKGNYIELGLDTQVSGAMSTSGGDKFSEYTPTNLQINVVIRMNNGVSQRYLTNVGEGAEWRPEFSIYKLVLNNITQSGGIKLQIQLPDLVIGSGDLNDLYIAIYPPFVWENKTSLYDYQKKWITYTSLDIKNRLNDVEPYVSDIFKGVGKDRNVNEDIDIAFGQCPSIAKSAFMQYANCFYYSDFSSVQNIGVEQLYKILLNQYLIEQAAPASRYSGKMRPKAITGQSPFTLCYDVYNQTIEATGVSLNVKEWTLSGEFVQIASYQSGDALGFTVSYEKSKNSSSGSSSSSGGSGSGGSNVPDWAMQPEKPKYTASEVGALGVNDKAADSDKLDGIDSTGFFKTTANHANNLDNYQNNSAYPYSPNVANRPNEYGIVLNVNSDQTWRNQLSFGTNGEMYWRQKINDEAWRGWSRLWTERNFNPDSKQDRLYDGWVQAPGYDANTIGSNKVGFCYSNNAPNDGQLLCFGDGSFNLQISVSYSSYSHNRPDNFHFRTRDGDSHVWNTWYKMWNDGNSGRLDADWRCRNLWCGDSDTGFRWVSDGNVKGVANGVNVFGWNATAFEIHQPAYIRNNATINGNLLVKGETTGYSQDALVFNEPTQANSRVSNSRDEIKQLRDENNDLKKRVEALEAIILNKKL